MALGEIVRGAFQMARGNRQLWFFGLLVAGGGSANFNFNGVGGDGQAFEDVFRYLSEHIALVIGIVVAVLVLFILLALLSLIAQGGLAQSVAAIDRGEPRSFGATWRAGLSTLGRLVLQSLLFFLIWLGFLVAIGLPVALLIWATVAGTDSTVARVLIIVAVALVAAVALIAWSFGFWIVSLLSIREVALAGRGPVEGLKAAYALARRKLGPCALLGLLGIALAFAVIVGLFIVALVVGLVLALPIIGLVAGGYTTAAIVFGVIVGIVLLAALLVLGGAIGTFKHSYWTLGWLRLRAITDWEDAQGTAAATT